MAVVSGRTSGSVPVALSLDAGETWISLGTANGTFSYDFSGQARGRYQYLLRFNLGASAGLMSLSMKTTVQVGPAVFPQLKSGGSVVTFLAGNIGVIHGGPVANQAKQYRDSSKDSGSWKAYRINTPGPIKGLYGNALSTASNRGPFGVQTSIDGVNWDTVMPSITLQPGANQNEYSSVWGNGYNALMWGYKDNYTTTSTTGWIRFSNHTEDRVEVYASYEQPADGDVEVTFNWNDASGMNKTDTHVFDPALGTQTWTVPTGSSASTNWVRFKTLGSAAPIDGIVDINDINFTANRTNYASGVPQQTATVTLTGAGQVDAVSFTAPAWATVTGVPSSYPKTTGFTLTITVNPKLANIADGNYSFDIQLVDSLHSSGSVTFTVNLSVADDAGRPDSDNDGIPDVWELRYFDTIADCVPTADSGGSSLTNAQEYEAGTNPVALSKAVQKTNCAIRLSRIEGMLESIYVALIAALGVFAARVFRRSNNGRSHRNSGNKNCQA